MRSVSVKHTLAKYSRFTFTIQVQVLLFSNTFLNRQLFRPDGRSQILEEQFSCLKKPWRPIWEMWIVRRSSHILKLHFSAMHQSCEKSRPSNERFHEESNAHFDFSFWKSHLYRVINHEIYRTKGVDFLGITSKLLHGITHRSKIDNCWYSSKVLFHTKSTFRQKPQEHQEKKLETWRRTRDGRKGTSMPCSKLWFSSQFRMLFTSELRICQFKTNFNLKHAFRLPLNGVLKLFHCPRNTGMYLHPHSPYRP